MTKLLIFLNLFVFSRIIVPEGKRKSRNECHGFSKADPFDKLEFGGESPRTMRAQCGTIRCCPDPLGIVTAKQFVKLEFVY